MRGLRNTALVLVIIGALNWGLIGFFQWDLVASIFGGQDAILSRLVYALVGLSGLYCISLLFEQEEGAVDNRTTPRDVSYGTEFAEDDPDFYQRRNDRDRSE